MECLKETEAQGPSDFALPLNKTMYKPLPYEPQSPSSSDDGAEMVVYKHKKKKYTHVPRFVGFVAHPVKMIRRQ